MSHRFILDELLQHIEERTSRIARFDSRRLGGWASEKNARTPHNMGAGDYCA
ncbi:hypothetical protein ACCUM_1453 [Candidatus Accumulibacter phosphatis]|uniref:Uncharacterized protein n=1 Tax=Candidatus Accumulibacter phosphatis TaxID=327160 RepID=A0A5S4ESL2_9PROT|nr:hypothetical protein ACCUM_1453 [Candidatus Accumulibacter phosphatis]